MPVELEGVQFGHHRGRVDGRGHPPRLQHEQAGEVTALDGGDGQVDDRLKGELDPAGLEKALSRPGEVDDEVRRGPAGEAVTSSLAAITTRSTPFAPCPSRLRPRCILGATFDQEGFPGYVASCDGKGHHVVREPSQIGHRPWSPGGLALGGRVISDV